MVYLKDATIHLYVVTWCLYNFPSILPLLFTVIVSTFFYLFFPLQRLGIEFEELLARLQSKWNSHMLLGGIQGGTAVLANSLAVSYKLRHQPIIRASMRSHA